MCYQNFVMKWTHTAMNALVVSAASAIMSSAATCIDLMSTSVAKVAP